MHASILVPYHNIDNAARGCLREGATTPLEALQSRMNTHRIGPSRVTALILDALLARLCKCDIFMGVNNQLSSD